MQLSDAAQGREAPINSRAVLILMLWSAPRSRSTAFYRMMIERGDFTGVHEPFSHVTAFGNTEISGRPLATAPEVIAELRSLAATRQVFIKDTTDRRHPEALADRRFLAEDAQHTFLIRHPRETIRSYLAVRTNPRIHEIGFEAQYEVYNKVRSLTGRDPLVVDAGDLMNRPADTMHAYCAHIGIDFRPHALRWQPSDRPEWQGGFSHWFTDVAASSGLAEVPSRRSLVAEQHPLLGTYLEYHLPFYQELYQQRLVLKPHLATWLVVANWPCPSPPCWRADSSCHRDQTNPAGWLYGAGADRGARHDAGRLVRATVAEWSRRIASHDDPRRRA